MQNFNVSVAEQNVLSLIWLQTWNASSLVSVLDLGLISFESLGPWASTKVESHVNFNESLKVSQPIFFFFFLQC